MYDTITNSIEEITTLKQRIKQIQEEKNDIKTKLNLVISILSAQPDMPKSYNKFTQLLWKDFIDFANTENSLPDEASVVLELQKIDEQLKELINFKNLCNKTIIAVGGGFSAGKSEFLSSLFTDNNIKLPIGLKPTTAIPIYITSSDINNIIGFNNKGSTFKIPEDIFIKLSHDYIKSLSFNLRELVPLITLETPIKDYRNIVFIDTPGYNPSAHIDEFTSEDVEISSKYLEKAHALIWLIGLDSHGTISTSDINFLQQLFEKANHSNLLLYIVANKADLKSEEDIEDILDEIEEELEDNDIPYEGICAYSSIHRKEYTYRKKSLFDYIASQNKPIDTISNIINELNEIFDKYKTAITQNIKSANNIKDTLQSLELDILEEEFQKYDKEIINKIHDIKQKFDVNYLSNNLKKIEQLNKQIINAVDDIIKDIAIEKLLTICNVKTLDELKYNKKTEKLLINALDDLWTCGLASQLLIKMGAKNKLIKCLDQCNWLTHLTIINNLSKVDCNIAIELLIDFIKDYNYSNDVCKAATKVLISIGESDIYSLINGLKKEEIFRLAAKALAQIGEPAIESLIEALEDKKIRKEAVKALAQIGTPAINPLIKTLKNKINQNLFSHYNQSNNETIKGLVEVLLQIGDPAINSLSDALKDKGDFAITILIDALKNIRDGAAKALAQIGEPAIESLIKALEDKKIRKEAVKALAQIGTPAINPLIKTLKNKINQNLFSHYNQSNNETIKGLVEVLLQIGDPAINSLSDALKDKGDFAITILIDALKNTRDGAAKALAQIGEPAIESLIKALEDKKIRKGAVEALAQIGTPAINPLIEALQDENTRDGAAKALAKMVNIR